MRTKVKVKIKAKDTIVADINMDKASLHMVMELKGKDTVKEKGMELKVVIMMAMLNTFTLQNKLKAIGHGIMIMIGTTSLKQLG